MKVSFLFWEGSRLLSLAFFLGLALAACTSLPNPIDRNDLALRISHLKGRVYLVEDPNYWKSNTVFYLSQKGVVFLNSGWTYKSARQMVWKAAAMPNAGEFVAVVPTSFLFARSHGLSTFYGSRIPILMQRKTPLLVLKYGPKEEQKMRRAFGSWRSVSIPRPKALFDAHFTFLDGRVLLYHFGVGHTPDNVVVYFPNEKIVYAGGLLSLPLRFTSYADKAGWLKNLKEIEKLDFDTIVSGYDAPIHKRNFLLQVREAVESL